MVLCTAGVVYVAGLQTRAQQETLSHPDTQKLVFENSFVRVFDIRVPAGTFEDDWLFTKTYVREADGRWRVAAFHASNAGK